MIQKSKYKTMKSQIIFIITILTFIACNQNIDSENGGQQEQAEIQQVQAEEIEDKDFGEIGFKLMETETVGDLKMGLTTDEVEVIVGEPSEVTPFELWGADGFEHQARVYQNETIELDFIKLEDHRDLGPCKRLAFIKICFFLINQQPNLLLPQE